MIGRAVRYTLLQTPSSNHPPPPLASQAGQEIGQGQSSIYHFLSGGTGIDISSVCSFLQINSPVILSLHTTLLTHSLHRKKMFTSFPSPAGMSLTKLPLGRNNSVMTSLFPPRESLVVTSRLGTGNFKSFFYGVICSTLTVLYGVQAITG
jgi:hypothetical protein